MDLVLNLVRHSGNEALFRAVEISVLAACAGVPLHVHAEGLRGTGKTTLMRAVRRALPPIRRIHGCLYNCDPQAPHCPDHRELSPEAIVALGEEWVPMPFLEISHSAKVGTVVGSIDLGRLVDPSRPQAALLPGTIPQAHRGILFVDEVNRLAETAPELADILLDAMGTRPGRVQIEETGLPAVELPVQVTVWAASNPDEDPGPLEEVRRQLSDRFDLAVYADRPTDSESIERILSLAEEPVSPLDEADRHRLHDQLLTALVALRSVRLASGMRGRIADLYNRYGLESLRAAQALQYGMRLLAALGARAEAGLSDLAAVAPHVLRHRVDAETLKKILAQLETWRSGEPVVRPRLPAGVVAEQPPLDPNLPESWLSRTLTGLRKNILGAEGRDPNLPPRTGALYARVGDGPGPRGLPGQAPGQPEVVDPTDLPQTAPPRLARPLGGIPPGELVRTEEELGRW
jgi:magnesium chelatase subunit I